MSFSFIFSILFILNLSEASGLTCMGQLTVELSSGSVDHSKLGSEATKEEVLDHFKGFKSSDSYARGSVTHALLAQTSWYTDLGFDELVSIMENLSDTSDISQDPASRAVLLQTILLSGNSSAEVLDYFRNFPEIGPMKQESLAALILIQTAYLTERKPEDVIEYFITFPRTIYFKKEIGFGIVVQTAFMGSLETPADINVYYRRLLPALFASANKGFVAIFKQTQLFSTRAFVSIEN